MNNIEDEGCVFIAETLKVNNSITELNLGGRIALKYFIKLNNRPNNYFGPEGSSKIMEALRTNSTLTKLDLWINSITHIKVLFIIINNKIGANGAKTILESLKNNTSLTSLNLRLI